MSIPDDTAWMSDMSCANADPDELFLEGSAQRHGKRICMPCPVKAECLAYAKERRIDHGVWGGLTERERRQLDKDYPSVTDWKKFIMSGKAKQKVA